MLKKRMCFLAVLCACFALAAQSADPVILSYQRNFIRASISTKLELLNDASRITTVNMSPLYIDALAFADLYFPVLGSDSQLMDIAAMAASKVAPYNDPSVLPGLRGVFLHIPESRVRIACLNAFAVLAPGHAEEISFLENWFAESLSVAPGMAGSDVKVLVSCAGVLGKIGKASSFPVLFRAATGAFDSGVVQAATVALNSISEGYSDQILAIIGTKSVQDTYAAFSFAMKKENLPTSDRGRIAEAAFAFASAPKAGTEDGHAKIYADLVRESTAQLTALKWSQASPQVIKYFYQLQGDYKSRDAGVDTLIPVIQCMGAMGTTESAQALSIFLGLLNSETEQKKTYNEQLMLAVIQATGDLGDKSAFDYLLYVGYLDYPETVKKASRDALARLQW